MAPSESEPCTQRLPAGGELQPAAATACDDAAAASGDRAPAAGTSESSSADQAPPPPAPSEGAEKKNNRAAEEAELVTRRPAVAEESARERLKRHRTEMEGRVRIPEMWGQERLLKDWVDCAVFDRPLAASTGLLTARDALVAEFAAAARRPAVSHGSTVRVQNGCS